VSDLTDQEQANVRKALAVLRLRCGTWVTLAKALRVKYSTLQRAAGGHDAVSARLALRTARLVGIGIDDILVGKWPPPNTCAHCGQPMPRPAR
jgi:hypothetical protein